MPHEQHAATTADVEKGVIPQLQGVIPPRRDEEQLAAQDHAPDSVRRPSIALNATKKWYRAFEETLVECTLTCSAD